MSLISTTNMKSYTDKLGALYSLINPTLGVSASTAVAGTARKVLEDLLAVATGTNDYEQENDLIQNCFALKSKIAADALLIAFFKNLFSQMNDHCTQRGRGVDTSIIDVSTYLAYYNGGSGGAKFSALLAPDAGDVWYLVMGSKLAVSGTVSGVMSPAIHPTTNPTGAPNGMGTKTTAGTFTAGAAVDTTSYVEVTLNGEVIVDFSGGGAPPVMSVAGTDHTGATSTTWDGTFSGNNPTAAVATTITPAVTAQARQTVAVASATGIVAGSVMTVNAGLVDAENIIVEVVAGSDITAVFRKAHSGGAALTGKTTIALTPSVAGRRCRSVSGVTLTLSAHAAGTVRVSGVQDRVGV